MKKIKVSKLKLNPKNPRIIKKEKFEQLKKSITEFPKMLELRPLIVDEDFVVLGGNMRLRALQELGIQETYYVQKNDLTETEKEQFIIKDNVSFGHWEWDLLANEWDTIDLKNWGLDVWGNMDDLLNKPEDEWVGMPDFETAEQRYKLIVHFETEKEREDFHKKFNFEIKSKGEATWSTWYPYKENADPSSLKYEI